MRFLGIKYRTHKCKKANIKIKQPYTLIRQRFYERLRENRIIKSLKSNRLVNYSVLRTFEMIR